MCRVFKHFVRLPSYLYKYLHGCPFLCMKRTVWWHQVITPPARPPHYLFMNANCCCCCLFFFSLGISAEAIYSPLYIYIFRYLYTLGLPCVLDFILMKGTRRPDSCSPAQYIGWKWQRHGPSSIPPHCLLLHSASDLSIPFDCFNRFFLIFYSRYYIVI